MMKNQKNGKKMKNKLPKWFDGTIYHKGDIVTNPFSGEEFYLNRYELSMYDFLKGAEYTFAIAQERMENHTIDDQLVKDFDKGRDWFIKNNSEAYMKLSLRFYV